MSSQSVIGAGRVPRGRPVWVGVDIGTQGVRITTIAEDGGRTTAGRAPLRSWRQPAGPNGRRHEQDPEDWWRATAQACREAAAEVDLSGVEAIAICSTSGTVLLTDERGAPLTPALMYDDDRGAPYVDRVMDAGGGLWQDLGLPMQGSWALPKALWLLEHTPDLPARGVRLAHCADFVAAHLCGAPVAADTSHALKSGYDALRRRWPVEVLEALSLPAAVLPTVVAPGATLGEVEADAAAATGLPAGARIVAGMTDGCAAQIAAGALDEGSGVSVLGTTLVLKSVTAHLVRDPQAAVYSHAHPDGGWLPGGASNVGARVLQAAFPGRDLAELDARAQDHEPAGAAVYPLIEPGERFPFQRPDAHTVSVGTPGGEADRYAALLQGVAFVERLGLAALARLGAPVTGRLALTGGATRSRYWSQLRADVLDRPVQVPRGPEPGVGMAVLAAAGEGSITETAQRLLPPAQPIEPRPDRAARFAERFDALLDALLDRGYVDAELAELARGRTTTRPPLSSTTPYDGA